MADLDVCVVIDQDRQEDVEQDEVHDQHERPAPVRLCSGHTTKGPSWGYPRGRFWDLGSVLELSCGKLVPKVDKPVKN